MFTLQDMNLNQKFSQGVKDGRTDLRTDKGNTICLVHCLTGHKISRKLYMMATLSTKGICNLVTHIPKGPNTIPKAKHIEN